MWRPTYNLLILSEFGVVWLYNTIMTNNSLVPNNSWRNRPMMFHALLEQIIPIGVLKPSRIGPMRTAVKQYAAILGVDPKSCLPTVYHLPHDQRDDQIGPLIEANAPAKIGSDAL